MTRMALYYFVDKNSKRPTCPLFRFSADDAWSSFATLTLHHQRGTDAEKLAQVKNGWELRSYSPPDTDLEMFEP